MADEVELDGPRPHSESKEAQQKPKYPSKHTFSPKEEPVAQAEQIQPYRHGKTLHVGTNLLMADPLHTPPQEAIHVTPGPQTLPPPVQVQVTPTPTLKPRPGSVHCTREWQQNAVLASSSACQGGQALQQSTGRDSRQLEDSTAQFENPLQKEVDDEIHEQAAKVIQEVSRGRVDVKTDLQRPFDPNLICPMCRRKFRIGEIQKFKKHVDACAGTSDD